MVRLWSLDFDSKEEVCEDTTVMDIILETKQRNQAKLDKSKKL